MSKFMPYIFLGIGIILALLVIYIASIIILRLKQRQYLLNRKTVYLEITPPLSQSKSAKANKELFNILHGFRINRSLKDRLFGREVVIALQIVSSRNQGIRYLIEVDRQHAASLFQAITSYLPEVKVIETEIKETDQEAQVIEFKQSGHYAFPLASADYLEDHDPVAYLAGMMTKLEEGEQMSFQLILTPVKLKETGSIAYKILRNEDLLYSLSSKDTPLLSSTTTAINKMLFGLTDMVGEVHHGSTSSSYNSKSTHEQSQIARRQRPARTLSAFELELMESIHNKVNQPLFRVSIRASVLTNNQEEAKARLSAISTSLHSYNVPSYQGLQAKMNLSWLNKRRLYDFNNRLPSLFRRYAPVLSSSEIASMYHFPHGGSIKTDNLVSSLSRTLAAPVSLKKNAVLDVVIGQNLHHGTITDIGLTEAERERHVYIIGGTGNGKTTMLFYSILQDIKDGKGVSVLDPHGDLADRILRYIPEDRIKDVIYMNPDDLSYPIGVNLLELPEGLTGDDLLREKDLITESTISVLRKVFSDDDSGGHRIEYVLRNSIQTALTLEEPTLFTIFELLNNAKYRRKVVKTLTDQNLKNFWDNELGKAGEFQRVKMAAGITAKIGRFLFSASARRVLEQPKSTINFEDILDSKKILICNFSKGMLGEDTSTLFGTTILAKIQTAALRRARITEQSRSPFFLYVDEFQNFATMSFVQMLSEARKYKLFLTMAEQSTSQQDQQRLVDIILANVGTIVCFRSGSPADERLVLPLFLPFINQGEIANLPAYSYYVRISAVDSQEPMSGVTVVVEDKGSKDIAKRVIESSRSQYAKEVIEEAVEAEKLTKGKISKEVTKRPSLKQANLLKAESSLK